MNVDYSSAIAEELEGELSVAASATIFSTQASGDLIGKNVLTAQINYLLFLFIMY